MKTRKGFVSNSSSSSFIVIADSGGWTEMKIDGQLDLNGSCGENRFGWQEETYSDFASKVNWALLQADVYEDDSKEGLRSMIAKVIMEYTGATNVIFDEDVKNGYIDHESIGGGNELMFESEVAMKNFLFNTNSCIENNNDN